MTHRQLYAEACRKAFEDFRFPENFLVRKTKPRKDRPPKNPNFRWTREEAEQLLELCRKGLRSFEIAKALNRSPKSIQKAFVRFGFPSLHNICPPCGEDNPAWKGGIHLRRNGYKMILCPDHPYSNKQGYVHEHRLVVEKHLGRYLLPSEVVHHKDGNPANNDISNLEVFSSNGEHLRATLNGIPHNVSAEGRKVLSEKTKARWAQGVFDNTWTEERRKHHALRTKTNWENGVYLNRARKQRLQQKVN